MVAKLSNHQACQF